MKRKKGKSGSGWVDQYGYRIIHVDGKKTREHRYTMELKLGRKLLATEVVHHKDGDKLNNSPSNLELLPSQAAHKQLHRTRFSSETHKECSRCNLIKPREEFSKAGKGGHNTDPHQGYCRQCAAEKAAERKASKRGFCPACKRENRYLSSKGICDGCNATAWCKANREKSNALRRESRGRD